jgi:hypothetical protein
MEDTNNNNNYMYNDTGLENDDFNTTNLISLQTQESRVSITNDPVDQSPKIINEINHYFDNNQGTSSINTEEFPVTELANDDYVHLQSQDLDFVKEMAEDLGADSLSSGNADVRSPVFTELQNVTNPNLSGCNSPPTINDQNETYLRNGSNTDFDNNSMQVSYISSPVGSPYPVDDMSGNLGPFISPVIVNVSSEEEVADLLEPLPSPGDRGVSFYSKTEPTQQVYIKKLQMPEFRPSQAPVQDQNTVAVDNCSTVYQQPKITTQEDENCFDLLRDPQNRSVKKLNADADKYIKEEGSKQTKRVWHCTFKGCDNNKGNGFRENCRARTHVQADHFKIYYACPEQGCDYKCSRGDNMSSHTYLMHSYKLKKIKDDIKGRYKKEPDSGRKNKRSNYNLKQNERCTPKKSKFC